MQVVQELKLLNYVYSIIQQLHERLFYCQKVTVWRAISTPDLITYLRTRLLGTFVAKQLQHCSGRQTVTTHTAFTVW